MEVYRGLGPVIVGHSLCNLYDVTSYNSHHLIQTYSTFNDQPFLPTSS